MYLNSIKKCEKYIFAVFVFLMQINVAIGIDRVEVIKESANEDKLNNSSCDTKYLLKSGRILLNCGKSVSLKTESFNVDETASVTFTLGDDSITAVNEFLLDGEKIFIDDDKLDSLVLIDTGAELCFGTIVVGITESGGVYNWGTLDEVVDQDGDIHCISDKVSAKAENNSLEIIIPAPFFMPNKDGSYIQNDTDRKYFFIKNGKFCKKKSRYNSCR